MESRTATRAIWSSITTGAAFFVDAQYFDRFGIEDNSPVAMNRELPKDVRESQLMKQGHDGVPWPEGKETLRWENLSIEKKFILDR